MTDDFKLTLLKNAVQEAPHLASVELAYDVTTRLGSGTPGSIYYNGYMEVLLSAAQNHDAKISPTTRSQNRRANVHSSFSSGFYDEGQYDIDTSVDTLYGLMLIIPYWHNTATVRVYLMTRGPNFRKTLGTSG
jgi:hypothetical protein